MNLLTAWNIWDYWNWSGTVWCPAQYNFPISNSTTTVHRLRPSCSSAAASCRPTIQKRLSPFSSGANLTCFLIRSISLRFSQFCARLYFHPLWLSCYGASLALENINCNISVCLVFVFLTLSYAGKGNEQPAVAWGSLAPHWLGLKNQHQVSVTKPRFWFILKVPLRIYFEQFCPVEGVLYLPNRGSLRRVVVAFPWWARVIIILRCLGGKF